MTRYVFLKGDDISVYINDELLCAVISANIIETTTYYDVMQYLSDEEVERINLRKEYNITLKKAFTNENPIVNPEDFSLKIKSKNNVITYEPCILLEEENFLSQNNTLTTVYKIKAYNKF